MPKYRKKPVVVKAVQITRELVAAYLFDGSPLPDGMRLKSASANAERRRILNWSGSVTTIHGEEATVRIGDWIIAESEPGRWYPCKPDIFEATYEAVDDA